MSGFWGFLRKTALDIRVEETRFERRGFRGGEGGARERIEAIGRTFVAGYHAAIEESCCEALVVRLEVLPLELRGFAYEGAAMGLALQDWLTPWNRGRLCALVGGSGDAHAYMIHVGAGWVLARVPGSVEKFMARFDPLFRWLVMDGYGFHEAFFHWPRYLAGAPLPKRVQGYARRAFDQGFGRCLWFVEGAEVERMARTIATFPPERRGDLWSGVGLAAVYAGQVSRPELEALRAAAGSFRPELAQGAAFAAKARHRAGNLTPYQDVACAVLGGLTAAAAARVTDEALENLPGNGALPAYEIWRRRIQERFAIAAPADTHQPTEVHR